MLDHLKTMSEAEYLPDILPTAPSQAAFTPADGMSASKQFDAKVATTNLFSELGVVDDEAVIDTINKESSDAFVALIGTDEDKALEAVGALSLPSSVRSSVAMLTNYQWDFVQQAQQLRSMAVSKIVAETDHPDARIRLNALRLLGSVTEVALFTERVEVKKTDMTPSEVEKAIREKLQKLAARTQPQDTVEDAVLLDAPASLDDRKRP